MTVYLLNKSFTFPHPSLADEDGLLAIGGDLSVKRLLAAYSNGIFPWFNPDDEIMWWAPNPRFVLYPEKLKLSKSFRNFLKKTDYQVSFNTRFEEVISNCISMKRNGESGTWITNEMKDAYINLYNNGHALSVEVLNGDKLVGGLYGVWMGRVFCGESMFHFETNASKMALYHLADYCKYHGVVLIDIQMHTDFFEQIGGELIPLSEYLHILHGK